MRNLLKSHAVLHSMLFVVFLHYSATATAQAYIPEATTLLPLKPSLPLTSSMQQLQQRITAQPNDDGNTLALAALYMQGARQPGYDDWFHQAEQLLHQVHDKNRGYWLLQADLQQQQHQFDQALVSLARVFAAEPDNVNASLMAARIYLAQANNAKAQQACGRLWQQSLFLFSACSYEVAGRRGALKSSYPALQQLWQQQQPLAAGLDVWLRGILAEQAELLGDKDAAIQWLEPILAEAPTSIWLKWSDLLLEAERPQQVYQQLSALQQQRPLTDSLLLRLALSEQQLKVGTEYGGLLDERMAVRIARGDTDHIADLAHYYLRFKQSVSSALPYAELNYQSAKEPDDYRLLQRCRQAVTNLQVSL